MKKVITNQQGFAVSGIIYPVFILFLVLIFGVVGNMGASKALLDRNKKDLLKQLDTAETVPLVTVKGYDITIANGMSFDMLYGIDAYDYRGNKIGESGITYTSSPEFSSTTNGVYSVNYKIVDSEGRTTTASRLIRVESASSYDFAYTGSYQTFEVPSDGLYQVELWGARGGGNFSTAGRGGYTSGNIELSENDLFNVFVGGRGLDGGTPYTTFNSSGYNGGGNGGFFTESLFRYRVAGGGGATDIRVVKPNRYRYVRDYIAGSTANTGNHWIEIQVYDKNNVNIALGKPVTGSVPEAGNVYSRIVDGNTSTYGEASVTGLQYVEIDLGAEYEISHVNVRHYFADGRTYNNTQTILYDGAHSADSSYDIFDNGWSGTYVEVAGGRINYLYDWNIFYDLKQRIMVAGGGAAGFTGAEALWGGTGGALVGGNGDLGGATGSGIGYGGTQTAGGSGYYSGKFGIGGDGYISYPNSPNCNDGGGGGGGYYGGGGGRGGQNVCSPSGRGTGGGGSSYISGHFGSNSINLNSWPTSIAHSGNYVHDSGYRFTSTVMLAGTQTMPNPAGGTQVGNDTDGYARIKALIKINN